MTIHDNHPPPDVAEPRNGYGITALAVGLVGILFGLVPLTGFIAVALGVVGVIFALANRGRLKRGRATNPKSTWFGLGFALIAIVLGIWGMVIVFGAVDKLDRDLNDTSTNLDEFSACTDRLPVERWDECNRILIGE